MYDSSFIRACELCPEGYIPLGFLRVLKFEDFIFVCKGKKSVSLDNLKMITKLSEGAELSPEDVLPVDVWIEDDFRKRELIECWAVSLDDPWSAADENITIGYNVFDAYREDSPRGGQFRAVYKTVGYEMITAKLYGYGDGWKQALSDCLAWRNRVQRVYNKEFNLDKEV